jgi:sarcosine oxidase
LEDVGGIAARMIEPEEVHERLPMLAPTDGPAMLDEDGGVIRTAATIEALTERLGERLILDEVLAVRSLGNGHVQLHSGAGTREFDRVIVCAGRGSPALAGSAGVSIPVHLWAHARVTYEVLVEPTRPLSCLLDGSRSSGGPEAYADPLPGDREYAVGLYRVPVHDDGSLVQPDALAREVEDTRAYALRALPGLAPAAVDVRHCMLTELPWGEDGIGIWQQGDLTVISGNNMFKHAPALGRALARAALEAKLDPDLEPDAQLGAAEK